MNEIGAIGRRLGLTGEDYEAALGSLRRCIQWEQACKDQPDPDEQLFIRLSNGTGDLPPLESPE